MSEEAQANAFAALMCYDGTQWLDALEVFWDTGSMDGAAWGPERVGTCKNSREVICGLVYLIDSDYAIKRFKSVSATSQRRGAEAVARFLRSGEFTARRKSLEPAEKPAEKAPAAKKRSRAPEKANDAIYSGEFAGGPKYEESKKDPEMYPTDSMKIWKDSKVLEGETVWRTSNGFLFMDENGPTELIAKVNAEGEIIWTAE